MTDDTEARLRAALHAYADRVEDPGTELPSVPAGSQPAGSLRRWRGALLVAAAVVAVIGGAWWIETGRSGGDVVAGSTADERSPSSEEQAAASAPEGAEDDAALSTPETYAGAAVPATELPAAPEVGVPYALDLYTHCGVFGTDVGGRWFAADPPLVEGAGNPPAGWGNPYQPGTLTLTSADEAVFTDEAGHEVVLRAAPESARPAPCD
jgi:hypothetical protein